MRSADLPVSESVSSTEWLNDYIRTNKIEKGELSSLSVTVQLIISELLEEIELMSTQVTTIALPYVKSKFQQLGKLVETIRTESEQMSSVDSLQTQKLLSLFSQINQLSRARSNIDQVRERLHFPTND
jgi:hypothetical protein